ncbi:MAG: DUF2339 domain-containing protein [Turneriella sp.]|nr:DUF2339 domain-containing protein [Turneriella sp.]
MAVDRIELLEKKLADAQRQIDAIGAELSLLKSESGSEIAAAAAPKPVAVVKPVPAAPKKKSQEWELFFGGNILGKAGILSIVIALSWFVKYAFDNHWVNESGKIFSGLLISAGLGFLGLKAAQKKFQALPLALLGGSIAGFLITIFTGYYVYDLFGRNEAFVYLALVLAAGFLLSHRTRSQSLFAFSLLGAFGLPVAFSQGENSYRFLFSYLLLVNLGYHLIQRQFHWRISAGLMLFLNTGVWSAWYGANGAESSFVIQFSFLTAVSILYLFSENPLRSLQRGPLPVVAAVLFPLAFYFYSGFGYAVVAQHFPEYASHFLIAIAGLPLSQFIVAGKFSATTGKTAAYPGIILFTAFKLAAVAAVVAYYSRNDLTLALLLSLAFYTYLFAARQFTLSYITSLPLALIVAFRLSLFNFDDAPLAFLNYRFAMFLVFTGILTYAHFAARRLGGQWYWKIPGVFAVAMLIVGTCAQVDLLVSDMHYRNLGYSYVLAVYTAAFLLRGFTSENRFVRQTGFVLAVCLVLKLYLYDIWTLSLIARIIAGLSLGAALVVLSFMYQKFREQLMKSFGKSAVWLCAFVGFLGVAELRAETVKGYQYVKKIQPADSAKISPVKGAQVFGRLGLDDEIYRHSGDHDIRLRFRERFLPYVLQTQVTDDKTNLTLFPEQTYADTTETKQTYVLKMPALPAGFVYGGLQLARDDRFEATVALYATDKNGATWPLDEQKLFRHRDENNLKLNLNLPEVKNLRLEISPPGAFEIQSVTAYPKQKNAEIKIPVDVASLRQETNKDIKYSIIYFNNPDGRKLSRARIQFKEPRFRRAVRVYEQTAATRRYSLTESRVISKDSSDKQAAIDFDFQGNRARKLKIEIEYGDDMPLTIDMFETWSFSESLVFEVPANFSANDAISVYYGNPYAQAPVYDLASRLGANPTLAEFNAAKEEKNPDFGYTIAEPPVSTWIIRVTFGLLLILLTLGAWRILGRYADSTATNAAKSA